MKGNGDTRTRIDHVLNVITLLGGYDLYYPIHIGY